MTAKFWYGNYIRLSVLAVFAFTVAFWSVVSCQLLRHAPADWYTDQAWLTGYLKSIIFMTAIPIVFFAWVLKNVYRKDSLQKDSAKERDVESPDMLETEVNVDRPVSSGSVRHLQWDELLELFGVHAFLLCWISVCIGISVTSWQGLQHKWQTHSTISQLSNDTVRIADVDAFLGEESDHHETTRLNAIRNRRSNGGYAPPSRYYRVVGNCLYIQVLDQNFDDAQLVNLIGTLKSHNLLEQNIWGVDLSGSGVTNDSIRFLRKMRDEGMFLCFLLARDTELTSSSLEAMNGLGLKVLDIRGTNIRLADFADSIGHASGFHALDVLYLSDTPTRKPEEQAVLFSSLRYIFLKDEKTTREYIAVQDSVPGESGVRPKTMVAPPFNTFEHSEGDSL